MLATFFGSAIYNGPMGGIVGFVLWVPFFIIGMIAFYKINVRWINDRYMSYLLLMLAGYLNILGVLFIEIIK